MVRALPALLAPILLCACGGRPVAQDAGPTDGFTWSDDVVWSADAGIGDAVTTPPDPDASPVPPPPPPPPPPPGCKAGDLKWCDGLVYSGWGQVACDPATGKWKTTVLNGKTMEDCKEPSGGLRPNTLCSCYHFFFNPSCCESPDCIVPNGTSGKQCPSSPGGLCDYCNPMQPECVEPGAKCIVTNAHETFCGRDCAAAKCPTGYTCMTVKLKVGSTKQCVPSDFSCYY